MAQLGSNRNLYLAALVACLTGALFGYSVGFIGGILVLPSFLHHFHLDDLSPELLASATSGTVSVWLIGAVLGVPLGMPICSRFGRRRCLTFAALLYVVGAVLQLANPGSSLAFFDAGRFLNGLGVGAGTLVSPMYVAEISPPSKRGMLLSGYQTAIQIAALAGFWSAFAAHSVLPDSSALQWEIPVAIQLLPGVLLLLGSSLICESPRFLAEKGRLSEAENALAWLRAMSKEHPHIIIEADELKQAAIAIESMQSQKQSFWKEIRGKSVRKRLLVGIGLMIAQNMVGLNALNYYAPTIFMSAGFTSVSSSLFLTGLFGVTKVLAALAFMFIFVHMKGNRFWLKFGSALCGLSMLVLAICVQHLSAQPHPQEPKPGESNAHGIPLDVQPHTMEDNQASATAYGIVAVVMVYIFAFAFSISLGPISWNVCSEIFPAHIKAKCCAITTTSQWIFQVVIAAITPHLLAKVGWATYLVYAACCLASYIFVLFAVPETQGVALGAAMDELFGASPKDAMWEERIEEVTETTGLLGDSTPARRDRRDSIGYSV